MIFITLILSTNEWELSFHLHGCRCCVGSGACTFIYFWPHMFRNAARTAVVKRGLGIKVGGIPVNTLYAMPGFASPSVSESVWVLTGNRDTPYTVGVLDLGKVPDILHVPDNGHSILQHRICRYLVRQLCTGNSVLLIGRVLAGGDGDLSAAYSLVEANSADATAQLTIRSRSPHFIIFTFYHRYP